MNTGSRRASTPIEMAGRTSSFADSDALAGGVKWRWVMVCGGTALLVLGRSLGITELTPWLIVVFVAVGGATNLALIRLAQLNSYPRWLPYGFCLADVSLVSIAIVYLGPGATIAGFFLVVLPCASQPNRALALFSLSTASVGLLIAAAIHGLLSVGPEHGLFGLTWSTVLDLGLFLTVAGTVVMVQTNLFGRVAAIHSKIKHATQGSLEPQTLLDRNDLVGKLERSLNIMLNEISSTIELVQQEAEEVELIAALFAQSTRNTAESSRLIVSTVAGLAQELNDLRDFSEAGRTESTEVVHEAENLQVRAEREESDALTFDESVQRGHDHVVMTSDAILAISVDVNRTMGIVNELGGLSRQIGSAALSIAKIARHTHVLALNAAIEAARAEEHGREFAVVAEQVRTLAGDAGRSARDVGNLIGELQAGITAAESALVAGGEKLNDIGVVVGEARSALTELRAGASNTAHLVSTTVGKSRSQAKLAASLASKMSKLSENSIRWSTVATEATDAMSDQVKQLHDLSRANQRLVELAKRLRKQGEMFSAPR